MDFNNLAEFHVFEELGQKILFDPERMNFYRLDDLSHQMLREVAEAKRVTDEMFAGWGKKYGEAETNQRLDDLKKLGLFEPIKFETTSIPPKQKRGISAISLYVTHQCNLSCRYCSENNSGNSEINKHMSLAVAREAVELLADSEVWAISLNGGEPLLKLPVMRQIVDHIKSKAVEKKIKKTIFGMTTNGTLIDKDAAEFCKENGIKLTVSVDGDAEVHDKARITCLGGPSHEKAMQGIRILKDAGQPFSINMVMGPYHKDLVGTVKYLMDLSPKGITILPASVIQNEWNIVHNNPDHLKNQFRELAKKWIEWRKNGVTPVDGNFEDNIIRILKKEKRYSDCEAGLSFIGIGSDGSVYPCHLFVDFPELARKTGTPSWPEIENRNIGNIPECRKCWARYVCAGGCVSLHYSTTRDLRQVDSDECRMTKFLIELSMASFSLLPDDVKKYIAIKAKREKQASKAVHG